MRLRHGVALAVMLTAPCLARAQPSVLASDAEMTSMFDTDQAARSGSGPIDWSKLHPEDARRRARTKALLDAGRLRTGDDFYHAAFVFQHGEVAADYLMAHTLAVLAAAHGRQDAAWIAAATLDRYLQAIGQPQIYGTQFVRVSGGMTQEPYDRTLVPDSLRAALGVDDLKAQESDRIAMEARDKARDKARAVAR